MPWPPMPVNRSSRSTPGCFHVASPPREYCSDRSRSLLWPQGSDALSSVRGDGDLTGTLANRAVDRALGDRSSQYADEIQRVLETTYDLIERTGNVDPS